MSRPRRKKAKRHPPKQTAPQFRPAQPCIPLAPANAPVVPKALDSIPAKDSNYSKYELYFAGALVVLTAVQAVIAYVQFTAMNSQNEISNRQLDAMKSQNDMMVRQAEQTESMIEVAQLDQRAWMSADTPELSPLEVGKRIRVKFRMANSGKTPARITSGKAGVILLEIGESVEDKLKGYEDWSERLSENGVFQHSLSGYSVAS